jgi:hypothetical protein
VTLLLEQCPPSGEPTGGGFIFPVHHQHARPIADEEDELAALVLLAALRRRRLRR